MYPIKQNMCINVYPTTRYSEYFNMYAHIDLLNLLMHLYQDALQFRDIWIKHRLHICMINVEHYSVMSLQRV